MEKLDLIAIAKETLLIEAQTLQESAQNLGSEIEQAVECIASLRGKLIVTGVGKSGLIGAKMAATFASTGTSSFFLHPTEALHGDLGMVSSEDGILAISYSGESEELSAILPHLKRFGVPVIGMSKNSQSTLAKHADILLTLDVKKEACPLDTAPTSSTTLTLALGDALAVCLMKKSGFRHENFASFHPGGSLGKRLFIKVKDLMRTEELPFVHESAALKEAIVVMSEGRLGNILVCDDKGGLKGVLSDGDVRRALMREDFNMEDAVLRYANNTPKVLHDASMLASEALEIIEAHKIQMLVVLDKNNKVEGVLHLHKLVEAGIKNASK